MDLVLDGIHGIMAKIVALEKSDFTGAMFEEIAQYIMLRIKDRTLDGKDVQGSSFDDYSPAYAEFRKQAGYNTKPDLTFSGHMLSAMTSSTSKTEAKIFFMDTQDTSGASAPDKAFWNNEDREFFGLSKADEKAIMDIVVDYYEKLISRRTLR